MIIMPCMMCDPTIKRGEICPKCQAKLFGRTSQPESDNDQPSKPKGFSKIKFRKLG